MSDVEPVPNPTLNALLRLEDEYFALLANPRSASLTHPSRTKETHKPTRARGVQDHLLVPLSTTLA